MGCAASATDRAERRRRGRALGHRETYTTGLLVAHHHQNDGLQQQDGRRRGCKVAPEPKEEDGDPAAAFLATMPGSPSFRFYCQKSDAVDALVADADGCGDSEGSVRITDTPHPIKKNGHGSSEFSKSEPEASRWLRFRGLALVAAAVCSLFSRHSSAASAPSQPPPAAAKPHHRCAASEAAAPASRSAHP